jgi:phthalate 4,5-dioxygenase oxygenase subunit
MTLWIMPFYTIIPPFGTHNPLGGHAWIPIDDENCWAWSWNYHPTRDLTEVELESMRNGDGIHAKYIPGTYRTLANKTNDYLMDREAQRQKKSFSGIEGIAAQDFSLQESMGSIADRTKERLGTSDAAIILARRRLLAALDHLDDATLPGMAVEDQRVRSTSVLLPKETPFHEGARDALVVVEGENFVSI